MCSDSSSNPVKDVKVWIFCINDGKSKDKKSDSKGIAEFTKLDDGVYRIVGRKDGLSPALFEFALVQGSDESVSLKFESGPDKKFYFEDEALSQQAFDLLKQGFEAVKQNKFDEAEKLLKESVELNPSSPDALYYLAVACLQQSKFDEGAEQLKRVEKLSAVLKTLPQADGQSGPNPYEGMNEKVKQLLFKMPALKGDAALKNKDFDTAIAGYSEALKSEPNNPDLYYNLALAQANAKKNEDAAKSIEKAIQLKPGEKAYESLKNQIEALKENEVLQQAQAVMDEGNKLLNEEDDAAGALKKFEEARAMVPEDKQSPLWRAIGRAHAKLNQADAAVDAFKKSVEFAPSASVAEYRNAFAQHYVDQQKYDEALDVYTDPKTIGSETPEQVLSSVAKAYSKDNPKMAELALERIIETNPENAEAYFELGKLYYMDGKEQDNRSKEVFAKYVEIGKDPGNLGQAKDFLVIIEKRSP